MVVKSKRDAWRIAELIFPGDFRLDTAASLRSGYSIYLGIRLEVVLEDNTVNIWVDDSTPTPADRNKQIAECKQRYGKQISDREVDPFAHLYFLPLVAIIPI